MIAVSLKHRFLFRRNLYMKESTTHQRAFMDVRYSLALLAN